MNIEPGPPSVPPVKTSGLAVTSLVLGILSLLLCGVGVVFSIPGLICGFASMSRVKKSGGTEKGRGLALTGTILSGISLIMLPVIGLLAAIAIPNFVRAREAAQRNACMANLRIIDGAKASWALENKKRETDTPTDADLFGPGKYIRDKPVCPQGGVYWLNPVDTKPTCGIQGHQL